MKLTDDQMFKVGFLLRCADEGLSDQETTARMEAAARFVGLVEKQARPTGILDALKSLGFWGLGLSALGGGAVGYGMGSLADQPATPEDVKRQELIAAYQQQADRVRRQLARGRYREAIPRKPQLGVG